MNKFKIILNLIWLLFLVVKSQAQVNWEIDPKEFENSMNITAIVNIQNENVNDGKDKIGAFVNGKLRGVSFVNITSSNTTNKLALMTIYSNSVGEEKISFKLFDSSQNKVYDAVTKIEFKKDGTLGSIDNPILITDNNSPTDIVLSNLAIKENAPLESIIGAFSSSDDDNGDTFTYELVEGDGDENNDFFEIKGLNLVTKKPIDYENNNQLKIRIKSIDSRNGFIEKKFVIKVEDILELTKVLDFNDFISPNNDGKNDVFYIKNIEIYKGYQLQIFDVNGVLIFQSNDYGNDWDGTSSNGKNLPKGVYYFLFRKIGGEYQYKGKITLVR